MIEDIKKQLAKIQPLLTWFRRYVVMIFILAFLGVYAFLIMRVNTLVQTEPTSTQLDERLKNIKRTKIDQSALDSIQQLQDQNVEVKALFEHARENPFNE